MISGAGNFIQSHVALCDDSICQNAAISLSHGVYYFEMISSFITKSEFVNCFSKDSKP